MSLGKLKKTGLFLARPEVVFFDLIWLMYLVFVGTIAQRSIGLYQAQAKYFSSWWYLEGGFLPLPGGYAAMAVLFIGLFFKLVFKSPWTRKRFGINVVHIGAMLLLFGGFLTAVFSEEGNMVLSEGETSSVVSSYHDLELAVTDLSDPDHDTVTLFGEGWLRRGELLRARALPFEIRILDFCRNCDLLRRPGSEGEGAEGFARNFRLRSIPPEKEFEKNRAGVTFKVEGKEVAVFQWMPVVQKIRMDGREFAVEIRHKQTRLPFSVTLEDFEKKFYAGTGMAKSFKSVVRLQEGDFGQNTVIWMNNPLRYRDYTFYQASFIEGMPLETTVLAAVKNVGRIFPYLSSLVMCVGLLLHLLLMIPGLIPLKEK